MYMDDIKLFAKNEKGSETLIQAVRIYSEDIGMEFSIKIYHANHEKSKNPNDERTRTTKSKKKNQNAWRKGNLQILGNIGSVDERKNIGSVDEKKI